VGGKSGNCLLYAVFGKRFNKGAGAWYGGLLYTHINFGVVLFAVDENYFTCRAVIGFSKYLFQFLHKGFKFVIGFSRFGNLRRCGCFGFQFFGGGGQCGVKKFALPGIVCNHLNYHRYGFIIAAQWFYNYLFLKVQFGFRTV